MKVTFKDLKQQKFVLEFEPSDLISTVKEKVSADKGWDAKDQKLIYSGKILKDENTIESYGIEEKGYVVCMVSKPKPKPQPAAPVAEPATPAPATTTASTPGAPVAPASSTIQTAPPSTPTPQRSVASAPAANPFSDPSSLTVGAERAEAIANMQAMGFERSQIDLAMRAAFFNPDRAVEYLLTGIPENVQQEQSARSAATPAAGGAAGGAAAGTTATATATAAAQPQSDAQATGEGEGAVNLFDLAAQRGTGGGAGGNPAAAAALGAGGLGNLDFLRNNPQFQQLRQIVQQQPQMLEPILQQLGAGNPHLADIITNHPEQFLQILGEAGDDDAPMPPGAQEIQVTEEERDAIERLCSLGFDRDQAIQAYFACDKNEDLAANFLFDQPPEDDEPAH